LREGETIRVPKGVKESDYNREGTGRGREKKSMLSVLLEGGWGRKKTRGIKWKNARVKTKAKGRKKKKNTKSIVPGQGHHCGEGSVWVEPLSVRGNDGTTLTPRKKIHPEDLGKRNCKNARGQMEVRKGREAT